MLAFIGPVLAAAVIGQWPGGMIRGQVIDEEKKPVARTEVIYLRTLRWRRDGSRPSPCQPRPMPRAGSH